MNLADVCKIWLIFKLLRALIQWWFIKCHPLLPVCFDQILQLFPWNLLSLIKKKRNLGQLIRNIVAP